MIYVWTKIEDAWEPSSHVDPWMYEHSFADSKMEDAQLEAEFLKHQGYLVEIEQTKFDYR